MQQLPKWDRERTGWLLPLLGAGLLAVWLANAGEQPLLTRRGYIFAIGPLFLLAGLHARLAAYLHNPARFRLAPLPVHPHRHWRCSWPQHLGGLLWAGICGLAGVATGSLASGVGLHQSAALMADLGLLLIHALLLEPLIPAACAYLGRRFSTDSSIGSAQRYLGGGWTAPEITVYLYAPALGLALAAALAMPGQLALAKVWAGSSWSSMYLQLLGVPLVVSLVLRMVAKHPYSRGYFEAVARLHESVRSLSGPPLARPLPGWLAALARRRTPTTAIALRLCARCTPALSLRLGILVVWATWAVASTTPALAVWALGAVCAGLWSLPFGRVWAAWAQFQRSTPGLPLARKSWARARRGVWTFCLVPPVLAASFVAVFG